MHRVLWRVAVAFVVTVAISFQAVGGVKAPAGEGARDVSVGIFVVDLRDIDLASETVRIDAYVWLRWNAEQFLKPGEQVDPTEADHLPMAPCDTLELPDSPAVELKLISKRAGYAVMRVSGALDQTYSLRRFPFDAHEIKIAFEDADSDSSIVKLHPDRDNSGIGSFETTGWVHGKLDSAIYEREFDTTFGDPTLPGDSVSTYQGTVFTIPIEQDGISYALKSLCALVISSLLAIAAYLVRPTDCDPRFGLPVGALFATVASLWLVGEALPPRTQVTVADWLHIISLLLILSIVAVSVISLRRFESGDESGSARLDRAALKVSLILYFALSTAVILWF